jgi:pimeloyl-ACP methyl ester carboxylesterase
MYVEEHGPAEGTPIVFLHGSMVGGWMWLGQVDGLPRHRCLLPDLPGIGRSADAAWVSFADAADRVTELIRARCSDGSAHVVGLSLGGILGLHLAAQHPEVVRSLLVSGVPQGKVSPGLRVLSRAGIWLYRRPWGARLTARLIGIPDDESLEMFLETARRTDAGALRRIADEAISAPLPAGLERIRTRTLAVAGMRDTKPARRAVAYLQAAMPHSAGRLVPGVGHIWNAEDPRLFTVMVRAWIDEERIHDRLMPVSTARRMPLA